MTRRPLFHLLSLSEIPCQSHSATSAKQDKYVNTVYDISNKASHLVKLVKGVAMFLTSGGRGAKIIGLFEKDGIK